MTNIIYQPIPDDASFSSSTSSTDHNIPSSSSSHQVVQSDQNLVTSRLNVETLSLYSVISRACFACTRPSPELLNDVDNSTTAIGEGIIRETSKIFSYKELAIATNYSIYYVGDGTVKGWIDENTATATEFGIGLAVAVKKLYQGLYAKERWLTPARLDYLAQLHHPNLARLVGYCAEEEPRLLVYEFISHGSLEKHLFKEDSQQLSWSLFKKIALGAAKGLAFLHNAETEVIHGDFKPSQVLLDSNYNARLSDFGLAKDSPPARYVEAINGDLQIGLNCLNGYTAPECQDSGDLTAKSDVYSFGVVLLEMLFSQRIAGNSRPLGVENIEVQKVKHCLNNKDRHFGVLSNFFKSQITLEDSQKAASLALKCLSMQADSRPTMNEVVTTLEMI